jgi:hypothetical protein
VSAAGLLVAAAVVATNGVATAPPPPNSPALVPLLVTVDDLPAGWSPVETPPLAAEAITGDPNDPCNVLLHTFDTAYAAPHAVAGFSSSGMNLIVDIVFQLASPIGATLTTAKFVEGLAACPTVTGVDGLKTTYAQVPFAAVGEFSAAYQGTWELGGFTVLFAIVLDGDIIILLDETGTADTTLLADLAAVSVARLESAPPPASG